MIKSGSNKFPTFHKKLVSNHILLAFLWILYCTLHSLLATIKCKTWVERRFPGYHTYFPLFYSLLAMVTLVFLLYFQYSFKSWLLINSSVLKYISIAILLLPGLAIMGISILSYYRLFGGIKSIYMASKPVSLDLKGIHKYVRHPLYSGTLLFIWGLFFIFPFLNNLIAAVIITAYVGIGLKFEEKKLIKTFANVYISYMKEVPSLFPRLR